MSTTPVSILGLGAVSPVGLSAPSTCAALRAGIARMAAFEGWVDDGPAPSEDLVAGRVPLEWFSGGPATDWPGHERWNLKPPQPHLLIAPGPERLLELAAPAAIEAWTHAGSPGGRVGLYLGLAEDDEATPIADSLSRTVGVPFELVRRDRLGRAAGLAAAHRAARHLRDGRVDVALVGAVDSPLRREPLERAVAAGNLRVGDRADGVIPGEAAAFAVMGPEGGGEVLASVIGSGVSEEKTAGTEEPNQGVGLTRALRAALAGSGDLQTRPLIVCDLNGERYRTLEWGFASVRALGGLHAEPGGPGSGDLWHPADCIGDTGAASGLLSLVWAVTALSRGYARSRHALLWGASDGPLRAAVVLRAGED